MKTLANIVLRIALAAILAASLAWVTGCGIGVGSGNTVPLTVNLGIATSTVLTASTTTISSGAGLTLTATVTPTTASGTVTFYDSATSLGTVATTNGSATLTTTLTSTGTHYLQADFAPPIYDSYDEASTSNTFTINVSSSPSTPITTGGAASIYVPYAPVTGLEGVQQYAATSNGAVSPTSTLTAPSGFSVWTTATDATGQIYIAGSPSQTSLWQVLVYAANATGAATPLRTITGSASSFGSIHNICTDITGQLYVAGQYNSTINVNVFSATANGTATPVRQLTGFANSANACAVDSSLNLYVVGAGSSSYNIFVFPSAATTPTRTITPPANIAFSGAGIAVDVSGDIYTIEQSTLAATSSIVELPANATTSASPLKTISGTSTGLTVGEGIAVDAAGNIYVVNSQGSILGFGPTASGNAAPATNFTATSFANSSSQLAIH